MLITIDATALLLRSAGVKGYLYSWLQSLRRAGSPHTFAAFPFIGDLPALDHDRSVLSAVKTYPRIAALHAAASSPLALGLMIRGSQIFHTSNQVRQIPPNSKLTATVNDMTVWNMGDFHTPGNRKADREYARRILMRADGLIAISENTRRDAISLLGIRPDKIVRIYPGIPTEYFDVTPQQAEIAKRTLDLPRPFVLSVGTIEPRKNVDRLLDGWSALPGDIHAAYDLVVAGPEGWGTAATMERLRNAPAGIRYLGYVPEKLLAGLTRAATVLAYPSLYEGFGLPVGQAMAAGVPVLTSNNSCLPEVGGEGAVYIDPLSVTEIRDALLRLLTSPSERATLSAAGRSHAVANYTWEKCARESIQFFEAVGAGVPPGA